MDSLNLSETQKNSLNSKNTGSNTSPIACACCGSKYYMQYLPQPCCFRIHHSEKTKCKDPRELFEESIKNPQTSFPPFPLFHPIFHSSLLPVNSCYLHNHLNDPAKNEENKCGNEHGGVSNLSHQERNKLKENNTETQDEAQKYDSGAKSPVLGHSFNLIDPHFNSFFQPTGWGDFIPWTCSPFFAPMMSYCLFWDSHKFAANASFKNYHSNETECTNNKNTCQAPSSDNKEIEKTVVNSCSVEDCLEVEQNIDESRGNIEEEEDTVVCANTNRDSICGEEDGEAEMEKFGAEEKEEESTECPKLSSDIFRREEEDAGTEEFGNKEKERVVEYAKISSDSICGEDEDGETTGFDSAVQEESNDNLDMDSKDLKYNTCFSTEPEDNNSEKSQLLIESEISYLMARQISENTVDSSASEIHVNLSDPLPADDNGFPLNQENQSGKSNLVTETENYQGRVPFKKTFKNFTIADQTNDNFFNDAPISVAAAGDLGGENCVGYKVTIVPLEKNKEQALPETHSFKFQQKDLELNVPKNLQKNPLGDSAKNSNEKSKCVRTTKTKIAKLLNNSKTKESKTDTLKASKQNVQPQKEANFVRCKHNCLLNDNNNNNNSSNNNNNNINNNKVLSGNEKAIKIQKTKNCTVAEQQIAGPKKPIKETNLKNQFNKSDKKLQRRKF